MWEGHVFINCQLMEENLKDVMIRHFQTKVQINLDMEDG
jgi:hypothetical protein